MIVFMMCDRVLLSADQKLSSLYSLMFYNVLAYCVNYLYDLVTKDNWSSVNLSSQSSIRHLAMSTTKVSHFIKFTSFWMDWQCYLVTDCVGMDTGCHFHHHHGDNALNIWRKSRTGTLPPHLPLLDRYRLLLHHDRKVFRSEISRHFILLPLRALGIFGGRLGSSDP